MELWTVFLRTIFIYFTILLIMRLMGKREVGKLSIFDLIVFFMIADISSMGIELETELLYIIVPILTLVSLQILLSFILLKSKKIRSLVDGEPSIVIKNGQIQDVTMSKLRYNMDDLLMQLREKNISDVNDVEFAILETSGKLSVIPKEEHHPVTRGDLHVEHTHQPFQIPLPVIIDGKVQDQALCEMNQNRFWLKNEIQKFGYKDFKEIYFACINSKGQLFVNKKDVDK